jgi:hypothetical protein
MRVDGKSITRQQAAPINKMLDHVVNHPHIEEVEDNKAFIHGTVGRRSIDLLMGGELYVVHERDELYPLIFETPSDKGYVTHIGSSSLFNECLDYSVWRKAGTS